MSDVVFESEWLEVTGIFWSQPEALVTLSNGQKYKVPAKAIFNLPDVGQSVKIQFDSKSNPINWR